MLKLTTCFVLFASPAAAFCYQSSAYDFAREVSYALDYLTCLHNEQADALSEHADIINRQSDLINSLLSDTMNLRADLSTAAMRIDELESRINDLEQGQ